MNKMVKALRSSIGVGTVVKGSFSAGVIASLAWLIGCWIGGAAYDDHP